ncbi:hypothetical protein BKP45_15800 [Anaerobacillus alkalidiazotrophicus]|uniref:Uncharacterized protein n=1 Tax=Anaerobacillus alkalidiazotrophicus TaxID=472963 RepID=A0A1S2M4A7_9BACI|nr:hypothetical protein [Anaerobacillus alkalidiazotrophicus]OIJ18747.1 hypothetical protein BKP45_15800 [Anaerobacillus alkalidiazotrophicus]
MNYYSSSFSNPHYFQQQPYNYVNSYYPLQHLRYVHPYDLVYAVESKYLGEIQSRPDDLIQEDATCIGDNKGPYIDGEDWTLADFVKVKIRAYECLINVRVDVVGFKTQEYTLKRGQSDFEFKVNIPPYMTTFGPSGVHKVVGWMVGKSLWMRYEYRFGGRVRAQIKPFIAATFPQLRFSI